MVVIYTTIKGYRFEGLNKIMVKPVPKVRYSMSIDINSGLRAFFKYWGENRPGDGILESCISCEYFHEKSEICKKYHQKPPARIIAFGCSSYSDIDQIPF